MLAIRVLITKELKANRIKGVPTAKMGNIKFVSTMSEYNHIFVQGVIMHYVQQTNKIFGQCPHCTPTALTMHCYCVVLTLIHALHINW